MHFSWKCRHVPSRFLLALLVASVALLVPPAARAAEPGLVGQWHLDSFSGTGINATTPDSSGYGNTGKFPGTPTSAAGRFGNAFAGPTSAEPMSVARPSGAWSLEPPSHVSLTAWVKQSGSPGVLKYIAAKGDYRYTPHGTDCAGGSYAL